MKGFNLKVITVLFFVTVFLFGLINSASAQILPVLILGW